MSEMLLIKSDDGTLPRLKVGDANSPVCYRLICSCKATLGPLAQFVERDGFRTVRCMRCDLVTVIQGASILAEVPMAELPEKYQPKGVLVLPGERGVQVGAALPEEIAR